MIEPIHILIIDDEAAVRYLSKRALNDYESEIHFYIKEAANGIEGIEILSRLNPLPHVILLDINMPVMDGYEFLEAFAQLKLPEDSQPHIYVVSTVRKSESSAAQRFVKGYFEKPLTEDHIKSILTSMGLQDLT